MRAGDVEGAAEAYRRYLELAPSAPDRAIIERMIERGRE
jgi:predicted RNA polymerase sigma factor